MELRSDSFQVHVFIPPAASVTLISLHLLGPIRIILIGQDEVEPLLGPAFVADLNVELFSGFGRFGEGDNQFVGNDFEFGSGAGRPTVTRGPVDGDALNGEARGVKGEFRGAIFEDGK